MGTGERRFASRCSRAASGMILKETYVTSAAFARRLRAGALAKAAALAPELLLARQQWTWRDLTKGGAIALFAIVPSIREPSRISRH
jgi:nitrogen fixation protein FixH